MPDGNNRRGFLKGPCKNNLANVSHPIKFTAQAMTASGFEVTFTSNAAQSNVLQGLGAAAASGTTFRWWSAVACGQP